MIRSGKAGLCEKTESAAFFQKNPDSALPCKLSAKSKQKLRRKSDNPKCGGVVESGQSDFDMNY